MEVVKERVRSRDSKGRQQAGHFTASVGEMMFIILESTASPSLFRYDKLRLAVQRNRDRLSGHLLEVVFVLFIRGRSAGYWDLV